MEFMHRMRALGAVSALCCAVAAQAGVLERVRGGGALVIAHRESSVPFSYVDNGKPVGYALDLCLRIAEVVRKKTGMKDMPVQLLQVTPANRIEMVKTGKADMECGSTTNNAERRKDVAFTIPHFITGARLLVPAASTVSRLEDLEGKKLVSTKARRRSRPRSGPTASGSCASRCWRRRTTRPRWSWWKRGRPRRS